MAFKMNGSPAKLGTISGTAGHSSALKMKAEADAASALKQMEIQRKDAFKDLELEKADEKNKGHLGTHGSVTVNATGTEFSTKTNPRTGEAKDNTIKIKKGNVRHDAILKERWKKGNKASGGTLNELVAARKKHKKGSAEYAEIQNKINKALGSKKVHKGTKVNKKGVTVETKAKGTTTRKSDGKTVMKGLGAQNDKTLTYADKQAEKVKIEKANELIKEGKKEGGKEGKNKRDYYQLEKAEIKSGRDNAKTGTMLSRALAKRKVKRNKRQLRNRNAGTETNGTTSGS